MRNRPEGFRVCSDEHTGRDMDTHQGCAGRPMPVEAAMNQMHACDGDYRT